MGENGLLKLEREIINLNNIENLNDIINPGSTLLIPKLETPYTEYSAPGAVKQPGKFQILPKQSIFDVIKRTGGLLPNAYFDGLVFTREDEKN